MISRSLSQAIPVRRTGTRPNDLECNINVSLNSEFAIAPHGTIVFPSAVKAKGAQSEDGLLWKLPSNWSSSRDLTYRRWFW